MMLNRSLLGLLLGLCLSLFHPSPVLAGSTLRVMAWPGYADPDFVQAFEQRYNVKVEVTFINSDDDMWERLSARQGNNFDVFAVNTAELQRYIDAGISVPIDPADIPNTANQLPRFRNLAAIPGLVRDGKVYAIPYTYSEMGLIYNRKDFNSPPDSFAAMWDNQYKGRVLAYQASEHNFSLAAMVLGLKDPFDIPDADFSRVSRKLVELRRNVLTFYNSPEEATRLYMHNDIALVFGNYGTQQVDQLQKAGADIGYVIPKEGALAWLDCWSITRGAENRGLAQAWINYMLEKTVSHALVERQGLSNTLEAPANEHDADRILWLQRVEDVDKRASLWDKIISGNRLESF